MKLYKRRKSKMNEWMKMSENEWMNELLGDWMSEWASWWESEWEKTCYAYADTIRIKTFFW